MKKSGKYPEIPGRRGKIDWKSMDDNSKKMGV